MANQISNSKTVTENTACDLSSKVCSRRCFLSSLCAVTLARAVLLTPFIDHEGDAQKTGQSDGSQVEDWMTTALLQAPQQARVDGILELSRFVEPIWFLLAPISWHPNAGEPDCPPVTVPTGFVTDLASIPRVFYSLLRPDGEYAYAAIVHDYLYWAQTGSREEADTVLKLCMKDFNVSPQSAATIYNAVRVFGDDSWQTNASLKRSGERRILTRFPTDPTTRWRDWKKDPANFY